MVTGQLFYVGVEVSVCVCARARVCVCVSIICTQITVVSSKALKCFGKEDIVDWILPIQ